MAANEYEPSAESVEAEARRLFTEHVEARRTHAVWPVDSCRPEDWRRGARFILRRQHARESAILAAVQNVIPPDPFFARPSPERDKGFYDGTCLAASAVKDAIRKLDAKPEPTLRECEKRLRDLWKKAQSNRVDGPLSDALDAWKAAVEREERAK